MTTVMTDTVAESGTDAVASLVLVQRMLRAGWKVTRTYGVNPAFTLADAQQAVYLALGDWLNNLIAVTWLADALRILAKADRGDVPVTLAFETAACRVGQALSAVTPRSDESAPETHGS